MIEFSLHRQLHEDCHLIGDLELSRVLLLNDCRYPWVVLVPRQAAITEVHQLTQLTSTCCSTNRVESADC